MRSGGITTLALFAFAIILANAGSACAGVISPDFAVSVVPALKMSAPARTDDSTREEAPPQRAFNAVDAALPEVPGQGMGACPTTSQHSSPGLPLTGDKFTPKAGLELVAYLFREPGALRPAPPLRSLFRPPRLEV